MIVFSILRLQNPAVHCAVFASARLNQRKLSKLDLMILKQTKNSWKGKVEEDIRNNLEREKWNLLYKSD
jgi:hypothetical protein